MVLTETKVSRNASVVLTEEQLDVVFEILPRTLHRLKLGSLAAALLRFLQHQTEFLEKLDWEIATLRVVCISTNLLTDQLF